LTSAESSRRRKLWCQQLSRKWFCSRMGEGIGACTWPASSMPYSLLRPQVLNQNEASHQLHAYTRNFTRIWVTLRWMLFVMLEPTFNI
jgi:hypothetical protein